MHKIILALACHSCICAYAAESTIISSSYYGVLNLRPDASDADIRKAFLTLAKSNHPDKNPHDIEAANSKIKKLTEAYRFLSDSNYKREYDAQLAEELDQSIYLRDREVAEQIRERLPRNNNLMLLVLDSCTQLFNVSSI